MYDYSIMASMLTLNAGGVGSKPVQSTFALLFTAENTGFRQLDPVQAMCCVVVKCTLCMGNESICVLPIFNCKH